MAGGCNSRKQSTPTGSSVKHAFGPVSSPHATLLSPNHTYAVTLMHPYPYHHLSDQFSVPEVEDGIGCSARLRFLQVCVLRCFMRVEPPTCPFWHLRLGQQVQSMGQSMGQSTISGSTRSRDASLMGGTGGSVDGGGTRLSSASVYSAYAGTKRRSMCPRRRAETRGASGARCGTPTAHARSMALPNRSTTSSAPIRSSASHARSRRWQKRDHESQTPAAKRRVGCRAWAKRQMSTRRARTRRWQAAEMVASPRADAEERARCDTIQNRE
mmetsp:Transcript_9166/g.18639  ORF Transcript_9166/g.18639 Transcript_9166/m.18639 type:complete len:270 (+) Transcript_9166:123-932(+)